MKFFEGIKFQRLASCATHFGAKNKVVDTGEKVKIQKWGEGNKPDILGDAFTPLHKEALAAVHGGFEPRDGVWCLSFHLQQS